jgi:hypothetical protein
MFQRGQTLSKKGAVEGGTGVGGTVKNIPQIFVIGVDVHVVLV